MTFPLTSSGFEFLNDRVGEQLTDDSSIRARPFPEIQTVGRHAKFIHDHIPVYCCVVAEERFAGSALAAQVLESSHSHAPLFDVSLCYDRGRQDISDHRVKVEVSIGPTVAMHVIPLR